MKTLAWTALAAVTLHAAAALAAGDVLDLPARSSALADQRLVTGIARAGNSRLVAVGQRGHIVSSEDGGKRWTQAKVPVSSDLTAVSFVDARTGFAVGHDGVVLGSTDGGANWTRLLDGRQANKLVLDQLQRKVEAPGATDDDRKLLDEAKRSVELGPDKPFLDLWFANASEGFVVGAYNLVLSTGDGGKTWESWVHRTDNPKLLNLYTIRSVGGSVYAAGEGGLLLKLDRNAQRFRALASPYKGSWFGLLGTSAGVLAFGMRGNAFISGDEGRSWQQVNTGLAASIVGGDVAADGSVVLIDQGGNAAVSSDGGRSFTRVPVQPQMPAAAIAVVNGNNVVIGGPRGLRAAALSNKGP